MEIRQQPENGFCRPFSVGVRKGFSKTLQGRCDPLPQGVDGFQPLHLLLIGGFHKAVGVFLPWGKPLFAGEIPQVSIIFQQGDFSGVQPGKTGFQQRKELIRAEIVIDDAKSLQHKAHDRFRVHTAGMVEKTGHFPPAQRNVQRAPVGIFPPENSYSKPKLPTDTDDGCRHRHCCISSDDLTGMKVHGPWLFMPA